MAGLIQLTLDGEKLINGLDGIDRERYLEPITAIQHALSQVNLDQSWNTFQERMAGNTLSSLLFVSDMLSVCAGEKVIDEASLTELIADVNTMLEKLLEVQLPEDLKEDLLDHLEDIRSAIIDYRFLGSERLKKTFDNSLGLILRRRDEMQEVGNSEGEGMLSDFVGLMSKLGGMVSVGKQLGELMAPIIKPMLPGGDN